MIKCEKMASSCSREGLELIAGRIPSWEEWWEKLSREVKDLPSLEVCKRCVDVTLMDMV